MKMISKFIYHKILGWKINGMFQPGLKKFIVIVAPHTSWLDFPIGVLARNVTGVKINYLAKDSLFKPPFGWLFKWLGGTPVDRSKQSDRVQNTIDIFNNRKRFVLALSPEGTRKKVDRWKTGFYFIAKGADIPVVMVALDFENKQTIISEPYYLTDDMEKDFKVFNAFYKGIKGKKAELG